MNARFAEPCRDNPLDLIGLEQFVERTSIDDDKTMMEKRCLTCHQDIYLGVFFDGTNNNKYRDTPGFSHSNVARLYEVYPGTPAAQTAPVLQVNPLSQQPRPLFPDQTFQPKSIDAHTFPYYRKIYVPGVGTPMPDAGDSGTGYQKTGGLAMALLGQVRLDWAMLQVCKQVHAAITHPAKEPPVRMAELLHLKDPVKPVATMPPSYTPHSAEEASGQAIGQAQAQALRQLKHQWDKYKRAWDKLTVSYDTDAYYQLLADAEQRLAAAVQRHKSDKTKPSLRKIRLSVFGFSRGSAQARAWVNLLKRQWDGALAGLPLQIDFLGIFDTVASVGLAQSVPFMDGHFAWASGKNMAVPASVKRCAHLVAAFEVRGSFPLDSVCQGDVLPPNCKEVVYPGVHSDVGGGYPPNDQGRAMGPGDEDGDKRKLSQISLAQMYREARMAGVPLAPPSHMLEKHKKNFAIDPKLREDFNAYIAATRTGTESPSERRKDLKNDPNLMYPTETQPGDHVWRLIRTHHGHLLQWQKLMLERQRAGQGGIASLPGMLRSPNVSKLQDIEDMRGAEEELGKEVAFLLSDDARKFDVLDDRMLDLLREYERDAAEYLPVIALMGPLGAMIAVAGNGAICIEHIAVRRTMREKQYQWDAWLKAVWEGENKFKDGHSAHTLFENYVHDSRAWFKALMRTDVEAIAPDDEEWFVLGGREKEKAERTERWNRAIERFRKSGNVPSMQAAQARLKKLQEEGPIIQGGREPYRLWGYLRHRHIYYCGQQSASLEREEARRAAILQRRAEELKAQQEKWAMEAAEYRRMTGGR
jgi:hypothetical protein